MNKSWLEPEQHYTERQIDSQILAACDDDPLVATILLARGFHDPQAIRAFLTPGAYRPAPPEALPDLAQASEIIRKAIDTGQRILVWGDFDVDGQTATALLVDGLDRLGADVVYYIPDRNAESHGIKVASLEAQIKEHQPDLLLSCDTGTNEFAALEYAREVGLPVIVTDHHDLGDHLPDVGALVNPRRLPDNHALSNLPGVGIAYKLMQHVYTAQRRERDLPRLLDLVALGIVGDVATQTADTRYLLQLGLERLRRTERIGLQALMEVARLIPDKLTAEQIGYQLSPRLNAAGRLGDASMAVELLTTRNRSRAVVLAQQLEGFNADRRTRTEEIEAAAEQMITPEVLESEALVLYHPKWHPGVIGIVAARLAERYGRPAVLLTDGERGLVRGSARSAGGYDISKALAAVDDLLRSYGGHPGAAGLSLEIGNIDLFRERFCRTLQWMVGGDTDLLKIDAIVDFAELTPNLVGRIHRLAPFGEGNPPVTLASRNVRLNRAAVVGFTKRHRRLVIEDENGRQQTFIWWRGAKDALPDGTFDVAYQATRNEIGEGQNELQLTLVDLRTHADEAGAAQVPTIQLFDWRGEPDPLVRLEALLRDEPDAQVWAEAYSRQKFPNWKRRAELTPASSLIIYTAPADPRTLYEGLERVQPQSIHVLAVASPLRNLDAFLAQLTVAAKNVIEHLGGKTHPEILCGATAQSPPVVRAGLEFLVASGKLSSIEWRNRANVQIAAAENERSKANEEELAVARTRLEAAYREVEAYRRYFRSAPLEQLLLPDIAPPVR